MKKNFKLKILSGFLAGSLCIGSFPAAFALENDGTKTPNQNTGNSANNTVLSAFVPTELPIKMNTSGDITVPTNAAIVNGMENHNIQVSDIKVNMEEGWKGVPYSDDVYLQTNDTQVMALQFRGDPMQEDGSFDLTPEKWQIGANQSLALEMQAKIPKQTKTGDKGKIAAVEYTLELADAHQIQVDWDNGLMLPGSKNVAVFEWATTDEHNTLQSVVSDNPDIQLTPVTDEGAVMSPAISRAATSEQDISAQATASNYTGERAYVVTAKKRGVAHVTGQLNTGETASFTVNVFDLPEGADGTASAPIQGSVTVEPTVQPGSSLNANDLNITIPVVQSDGSTTNVPITPDSLPDTPLTEGDNEITVTTDVNGVTIHIVIHIVIEYRPSVTNRAPESLTVTKQPDKTEYRPGENFDQTGMEVEVTYNDGTKQTLTGGYIVTDGANLPNGKDGVNITYTENGKTVSTTQPITTAPDSSDPDSSKTPVSIAVTPDSYKDDYAEGEDFDPEGMTVEVTYGDGHKEIKDSGFEITDGENLPLDKSDVNVVYTEDGLSASCKAPITVSPAEAVEPESIAVTKPPYTTDYTEGENFDKSGMKITVTYTDGHTEVKSSGFEITDGVNLPVGKTFVTVSYTESEKTMTTTTPITVKEENLIDYMENVSYPYHALIVSTSNTSGYFFRNTGTSNKTHLLPDVNGEMYLTAKGFDIAQGRVIRVKPGTYDLSCSIGLVTSSSAADISITLPDNCRFSTIRGTGTAFVGGTYYISSGGSQYKYLRLSNLQDGDVIKVYVPYGETATNVSKRFDPNFYIICGEHNLPDDIIVGTD